MNKFLLNTEIIWNEPRVFNKLKRKIENENKSIIERIGWRKILLFSLIFIISLAVWSITGKIAKMEIGLFEAIVICTISGFLIIYIISFLNELGSTQISFCGRYIYFEKGGENPRQLDIKNISYCRLSNGLYKEKEYNAIKIHGSKGLIEVIFLPDKLILEKVLEYFKNNGVECIA